MTYSLESPPPDYRPPPNPCVLPGAFYTLPARRKGWSLEWDCPWCDKRHRITYPGAEVDEVVLTTHRCPVWLDFYGGPASAHLRNEMNMRWGGNTTFDRRLFLRVAA